MRILIKSFFFQSFTFLSRFSVLPNASHIWLLFVNLSDNRKLVLVYENHVLRLETGFYLGGPL